MVDQLNYSSLSLMKKNMYYIKKYTGFSRKLGDELKLAHIYQPTTEGVIALCAHYASKYTIDLRCIDLRGHVESADNLYRFFEYLQSNPSLIAIEEGCLAGLILSHGQFHVVPVLLAKKDGIVSMVVFDSTSGPRIKGYFRIAQLFPEFQFYLNSGTRQADEGSCMTDALCVLKEALMIPDIVALIQSKQIDQHEAFEPSRTSLFKVERKPDYFNLFKMPERLLLTAQRSKYLVEADADVDIILRGGKSLKSYRDDFLLEVVSNGLPTTINGYLYLKAKEHRDILNALINPDISRSSSYDELEMITQDFTASDVDEYRSLADCSPYPR